MGVFVGNGALKSQVNGLLEDVSDAGAYIPRVKLLDDGTDLDEVVEAGFYRTVATCVNCPSFVGGDYSNLIVARAGDYDTIMQVYGQYTGVAAFRCCHSYYGVGTGTWSDWMRLGPDPDVNFGSAIGSGADFTIPGGYEDGHRFVAQCRISATSDGQSAYLYLTKNGTRITGQYGMQVDQYVRSIDHPFEFVAKTGDVISYVFSGSGGFNSISYYA